MITAHEFPEQLLRQSIPPKLFPRDDGRLWGPTGPAAPAPMARAYAGWETAIRLTEDPQCTLERAVGTMRGDTPPVDDIDWTLPQIPEPPLEV